MAASSIYCPRHVGGKPGCEECYHALSRAHPLYPATTTALYAGSFDPWHRGHSDILEKALRVFDKVLVLFAVNPAKERRSGPISTAMEDALNAEMLTRLNQFGRGPMVEVHSSTGLLVDFVKIYKVGALIRGIRNGMDLEHEKIQQYWNEDLGMKIPTVCFITDRSLVHISSTAERELAKLRAGV